MSGSFAPPRLLFFNAAPHGSRRGLLSSAAPQLTPPLDVLGAALHLRLMSQQRVLLMASFFLSMVPARTGQGETVAAHLPLEWSATRNIAWKQSIPGHGWSSPVVNAGRVYLTTAVEGPEGGGSTLSLRALCLDEAAGSILWDSEVFGCESGQLPRIHAKNSHASPTPLLAGGRVYVHFGHQGTACLDLDGHVLWRNTNLGYPPVHGSGSSPILADDALIFSCDGASQPFVVGLDK